MGMIPVKCPNCGADIQLDDSREFGFCSFCGTKVMQDKVVVEHRGSVKVDQSEFIQKSIANGRRALSKEDWEEVEKYYNLVEQNVPDNIEALFFSAFGKAMLSLTDSDYFKREQKFNVLIKSMSVISDYYETTTEDKKEVLNRINDYLNMMSGFSYVYNVQATGITTGSKKWCDNLLKSVRNAFHTELFQIYEKHNESYIQDLLDEYQDYLNKKQSILNKAKEKKTEKRQKKYIIFMIIVAILYLIIFILEKLNI